MGPSEAIFSTVTESFDKRHGSFSTQDLHV